MPKEDLQEVETLLKDVPSGKLLVRTHTSEHESPFSLENISTGVEGKGLMETWSIFPGVSLTHAVYAAEHCEFLHPPHGTVVQINHCRRGRVGWEMPGEVCIYLGPGDLSVHDQLTCHPEQRFTIQQLSRQYLMNETTLKSVFKSVYGAPIAAYMKEYRIQQAARLLRETDCSILEIARQVGYDNQGKFAAAFRSVLHLPPTEYRRQSGGQRAEEIRH